MDPCKATNLVLTLTCWVRSVPCPARIPADIPSRLPTTTRLAPFSFHCLHLATLWVPPTYFLAQVEHTTSNETRSTTTTNKSLHSLAYPLLLCYLWVCFCSTLPPTINVCSFSLASCPSLSMPFMSFDLKRPSIVSWRAGAFDPRFNGIRPISSRRSETLVIITGWFGGSFTYTFISCWMTPFSRNLHRSSQGSWMATHFKHWTVRAFKAGSSRFYTLHVYPVLPPEKFRNGGKYWVSHSLRRNEYREIWLTW
jgi:hypothetical protein